VADFDEAAQVYFHLAGEAHLLDSHIRATHHLFLFDIFGEFLLALHLGLVFYGTISDPVSKLVVVIAGFSEERGVLVLLSADDGGP
jgi:hypothetical protein